MQNDIFFLLQSRNSDCKEVIVMRDGGLRIKVYSLNDFDYVRQVDKLTFYGDYHENLLAFEVSMTEAIDFYSTMDALRWYSNHLNYPEMTISRMDPRVY